MDDDATTTRRPRCPSSHDGCPAEPTPSRLTELSHELQGHVCIYLSARDVVSLLCSCDAFHATLDAMRALRRCYRDRAAVPIFFRREQRRLLAHATDYLITVERMIAIAVVFAKSTTNAGRTFRRLAACGDEFAIRALTKRVADRADSGGGVEFDTAIRVKKCLLNATDHRGRTASMIACEFGRDACLRALLDAKADIEEAVDDTGLTTLMVAVSTGHDVCAQTLVDAGAVVDVQTDLDACTALTIACCYGHAACVEVLLEAQATLDHVDGDGYTPLMNAAEKGHESCLRILIDANADVNHCDDMGCTALMLATQENHEPCVRALVGAVAAAANNADPITEDVVASAMRLACSRDFTECLRELLEAHVRVDQTLIYACRLGRDACAKVLIAARANLEAKDESGSTALIRACAAGHPECARLLIDAGAITETRDLSGRSALEIATLHEHGDCVAVLQQHKCDAEARKKKKTARTLSDALLAGDYAAIARGLYHH